MAEDNYEEILSRGWDEIPEVRPLPTGSYLLKGRGAKYHPAKGDGNPSILFVYTPMEPMDDVDDAELKALGANYDIKGNRIFYRAWLETGADWDTVRKHLAKHGIETKGKNISDSLGAFKGTEVVAHLGVRNYTNGAGDLVTENQPNAFHKAD